MNCISNMMRLGDMEVMVISLKNRNNLELRLMNYGASILEFLVPDRTGKRENIVLTYDNPEDYIRNTPYFGVTVGRTAGRIGGGCFRLGGTEYRLDTNAGKNNLHGGGCSFSFRLWNYSISEEKDKASVEFTYFSRDMEEGYPGNLEAKVSYILTDDNELIIEYNAVSDRDTLCNLTNHSYFNLSGNHKRKVTEQYLTIKADSFVLTDGSLIPTGELMRVEGTPMDFNGRKLVGRDIEKDFEPLHIAGGYDHTWLLSEKEAQVEMYDEQSGRKMTMSTTYPAVVVYTYNYADNERLKYGKAGTKYDGICFEAQYEPDGINHEGFSSSILRAGSLYNERTTFKLEVL